MHEYEHNTGSNIEHLINYFLDYEYHSDGNDGRPEKPSRINYMGTVYNSTLTAIDKAEENSYYNGTSISIAIACSGKLTQAFNKAYQNFKDKYKEYEDFKRNLNIGYGRKSSKVTCPRCGSSISLKFGAFFKCCPVCASNKIISDSNWNILDTKRNLAKKASVALEKEANKCNAVFVAAIGWHS